MCFTIMALEWSELHGNEATATTHEGYGYYALTSGHWGYKGGYPVEGGSNLDDAKAAAQADYEARIRSALVKAQPSEPVIGDERIYPNEPFGSASSPAQAGPVPVHVAECMDCGLDYGDIRFQDLVVPNEIWKRIAPDDGLLCPSCLCGRATALGIECEAQFRSGAFSCHTASPPALDRGAEWEPMETAPKDGSRFLALWGGAVVIARWLDNSHTSRPWSGWRHEGMHVIKGLPQGWQSLPSPNTKPGDGEPEPRLGTSGMKGMDR